MQDNPMILGFTAGELSPWLSTRFDLSQHAQGSALLENFLVEPYGGLRRRQGTRLVATLAHNEDACKLFSFFYSNSDALMLEFYPSGLRFYADAKPVLAEDGQIYRVETPWVDKKMIDSLRLVQVNDVIYATCPYCPVMELHRYANTNWTCSEMIIKPFPRATMMASDVSLRFDLDSDGEMVIEAEDGSAIFTEEMVGKEHLIVDFEAEPETHLLNQPVNFNVYPLPLLSSMSCKSGSLWYQRDASRGDFFFYECIADYTYSLHYTGSNNPIDYPAYFALGCRAMLKSGFCDVVSDWEIVTTGTWTISWVLKRSYDDYDVDSNMRLWDWETVKSFEQNNFQTRKNWSLTGSERMPCRMMLLCTRASTVPFVSPLSFSLMGRKVTYAMKITSVISSSKATAKVYSVGTVKTMNFRSRNWSFGAFGPSHGYPCFAGFHEGRIWFGGTRMQPTTLRASMVDDFNNFFMDSEPDSALHLTLASDDQSRICWMSTARGLLFGTAEGEWILQSSDSLGLAPTNASFVRQSSVGSDDREAYSIENSVFYVQRGGKRLREISYKLESDGFSSTDTSLLSEHLFASGVREWVVQRGGNSRVWVLMNDGTLAVLTTNVAQRVTAWQRVSFAGARPLHISSLPSSTSLEDEIWLVMRRRREGKDVMFLECIREGQAMMDCYSESVYRDGALRFPDLSGLLVWIYPQGHPELAHELELDADGGILIDLQLWEACHLLESESIFAAGLKIVSQVETMPFDSESNFNSVNQLGRVTLRLLSSDPCFDYRPTHVEQWERYDASRDWREYPYSGSVRLSQIPSPGVGMGMAIRCDSLRDFNLLSLSVERDFHGK